MVQNSEGAKNIFRLVEHIHIAEIQNQARGYFGLLGVGNIIAPVPSSLTVSPLTHLSDGHITQATEIQKYIIGCAQI